MKNRKIIKIISLLVLTVLLLSTFAMPAFATVPGEESPVSNFFDNLFEAIISVLGLIAIAILLVLYVVFIAIVIALALIFELGQALFELISFIVNSIIGLF